MMSWKTCPLSKVRHPARARPQRRRLLARSTSTVVVGARVARVRVCMHGGQVAGRRHPTACVAELSCGACRHRAELCRLVLNNRHPSGVVPGAGAGDPSALLGSDLQGWWSMLLDGVWVHVRAVPSVRTAHRLLLPRCASRGAEQRARQPVCAEAAALQRHLRLFRWRRQ
jgi:hypothetical protein